MILYRIPTFRNRERGMVTIVVMMDPIHILGEKELIVFVYMDCTIFPPHKWMFHRRTIVYFHNSFKTTGIGRQTNADSALQTILPRRRGCLRNPANLRAILHCFHRKISRHKSRRPMMERKIPLHTTANPMAIRPHAHRFNAMVTVKEMVISNLIIAFENSSP